MSRIGVWEIYEDVPKRIEESSIDLEKNLETWIENDPSLVYAGLNIIARQLTFDQGQGRLDLLALNTQGHWMIIEIKRGEIEHETMTQVLYYAACVANMKREEIEQKIDPKNYNNSKSLTELLEERDALDSLKPENRNVSMIIVGTRRTDKLDQMV